ncbi:ATP-binding protein [Myxococcota bacterium]|nr:ATP-binding protein [Myxococcota bacterium]
MGALRSLIRSLIRLERVLDLMERVLGERTGRRAEPEMFQRHLAARWAVAHGAGRLIPIVAPDPFDLEDLVGVERSVTRLVDNIEQFVEGYTYNHTLLYGDRGTGKSSAVKGLLSRFGGRGLRVVELHKDHLEDLPDVFDQLRELPWRFLLFCDDLSFDSGDSRHRELKAALQGSLVAPPSNVCLVATSNRRHLLSESMQDNQAARLDEAGELRLGEGVEEKLALSDRFGMVLGFYSFNQATYLEIVRHYANKAGVESDPEALKLSALRWALDRSSRSGRTAKQFVDDLAGAQALDRNRAR